MNIAVPKTKAIFHYLFRDDFVKNSFIFFVGSGIIAFLNYLYHPVLGKLVSVSHFGELEVLYSFYNIFGIFLLAFSGVVVHATTNIENEEERAKFISHLGVIGLIFSGIISSIIIVLSPVLQSVFNFESLLPFLVFAALLPLSAYVGFGTSFFQGQKKFIKYTFGNGIVSFLKVMLTVFAIYLGGRVLGVTFAFLMAQVTGALYIAFKLRGNIVPLHKRLAFTPGEIVRLKKEVGYVTMVLMMNLGIVIFYTADILIMKYLFSPETAGLYSGVSTVSKIIFFATQPLSGVLLASIRLKNEKRENHRLLYLGLLAAVAIGATVLVLFDNYGGLIIKALLGEKFVVFALYLKPLSLLMFLAGIYNVLLTYLLALRNRFVLYPVVVSLCVLVLLLAIRHATVISIIHNFMFAVGVGVIFTLFGFIQERQRGKLTHE